MSDDLNCLGQTPAQAKEFDAMCAEHDASVRPWFAESLRDICRIALREGMEVHEIMSELIMIQGYVLHDDDI